MQDLIISLYLYPCIVTGYRIAARWPLVGTALRNTHHLAVSHKSRIAPYGVAGLALFVFLPLWGTGPYVGVAAGYLMGFGILRTFGRRDGGQYHRRGILKMGPIDVINEELTEINRNLPWAAAALILFASLAATVWNARRKRRNAARAGARGTKKRSSGLLSPPPRLEQHPPARYDVPWRLNHAEHDYTRGGRTAAPVPPTDTRARLATFSSSRVRADSPGRCG